MAKSYKIYADGVLKLKGREFDSADVPLDMNKVQINNPEAEITVEYFTPEWEKK